MFTQARRRSTRRPHFATAGEPLESRVLLAATLLKDINASGVGSSPSGFTEYHGALYFAAEGPQGREVYRSAGPDAGATLLRDIAPGIAGSDPDNFAVVGDTLYFSADGHDGAGVELWKTDGTEAGTVRVSDINPGAADSSPHAIADLSGTAYFTATAPGFGKALFKSDGTGGGATMVFDPDVTSETLGPLEIVPLGDKLFFTSEGDADHVGRLFVTDGTTVGTEQLATFSTWTGVGSLTPFGDKLLFAGYNFDAGHNQIELWSSDGTPAGTRPVYPANNPYAISVAGDTAYFLSDRALFKTDGTSGGTTRVASIDPLVYTDSVMVPLGGRVYFTVRSASESSLWVSDGTPEGTVRLKTLPLYELVASGGRLYFGSTGGLWTSDGTEAGTVLLKPMEDTPYQVSRFGNGVAFVGRGTEGDEPWTSDGTADGTRLLADVNPTTRNSALFLPRPGFPASVNGRVVFAANDSATLPETDLWSTDGTPGGTVKLADFQRVDAIAVMNGFAYVLAAEPPATPNGLTGPGLWRTDGTPQGTTRVIDVNYQLPVSSASGWNGLVQVNGVLYFSAGDPQVGGGPRFGTEVWRSDGTTAGTYRVTDIRTGSASSDPRFLTAVGPNLYFVSFNDLWKLDGATGALTFVNLFAGTIRDVTMLDAGTVLLRISSNQANEQLWKSDGTAAGTALIKSFNAFSAPAVPDRQMVNAGGVVYFATHSPGAPEDVELWKTDGTPAGTVRVKDINPGDKASSYPVGLIAWGDRLYFSAIDPAAGREQWVSDGTDAGTHRVRDVNPGPADSITDVFPPAMWSVIGDRLYFSADDGTHGTELWSSDGTEAGTSMVYDTAPGERGSSARFPVAAPGRVVYWADDGLHGIEPWAVDLGTTPPAATVVGRHVFYNGSSFDGITPGADAADDGAIASDKAALLPGQAASFANVISYDKGINGVMVDVADLPAGAVLTAVDFGVAGANAGAPTSVTVRRGAGLNGSDRVTLIFLEFDRPTPAPQPRAVANGWLTITVKANDHTGLAAPDVFSFGNLIGETGDAGGTLGWRVNALDVAAVKRDLNTPTTITSRSDFNRDGRVNALDVAMVKKNLSHSLPIPIPIVPLATAAPPRRITEDVLA